MHVLEVRKARDVRQGDYLVLGDERGCLTMKIVGVPETYEEYDVETRIFKMLSVPEGLCRIELGEDWEAEKVITTTSDTLLVVSGEWAS